MTVFSDIIGFLKNISLKAFTNSSPSNGDLWYDGTDVNIRVGGVTRTLGGWSPQAGIKTADQVITTSTALADCTGLSFTGVAGATYAIWLPLKMSCNTSGGFKWDFTLPSGGSGSLFYTAAHSGLNPVVDVSPTTGSGGAATVADSGGSYIGGYITFSAAGTAQFRFAQNASTANATTVKKSTVLFATRVS